MCILSRSLLSDLRSIDRHMPCECRINVFNVESNLDEHRIMPLVCQSHRLCLRVGSFGNYADLLQTKVLVLPALNFDSTVLQYDDFFDRPGAISVSWTPHILKRNKCNVTEQ